MKKTELNPTNEFHILRHFSSVPGDYKRTLIGQEYYYPDSEGKFSKGVITSEDIENALQTTGSKFFPNIPNLTTPKDVIILIQSEFGKLKNIDWKEKTNKRNFAMLIEYPEPVGFKNLVPINTLSPEDRKRIETLQRGNHEGDNVTVKIIKDAKAKEINTIEVGITDFPQLPFYSLTAYPGDLSHAPDFPNSSQSPQEFEKNKIYWNTHIFIV